MATIVEPKAKYILFAIVRLSGGLLHVLGLYRLGILTS